MGAILIKTKNKLLMGFTVFLILFVLIGSVSAANDYITSSGQDTYNKIDQEKISTGNDDSGLDELENEEILKVNNVNTTLKTSVGGDTFADIQTAISSASSGDTIELDGLYTGSGTAVIVDKDNLTIVGNNTILDAQGQSRILNITGTGIILKDIIFINGNVTDNGGAICWYGDNGTVNNCNFTYNKALLRGGAVYWCGVNGTITDSNFINNTATEMGGAIYWCEVNGTVNDSNFINNTAEKKGAGAIHWDSNSDNGMINNCNFTNNIGTQKGGAICWCGVNGTINDSNFINDTSYDQGGAIFWDPNAINGVVNNGSFINNNGPNGGAVYWFGPYGRMNNCIFINNTATVGGAVNWQKTHGLINNCIFINNTANSTGGAVYWEGSNGTGNNCNFINNMGSDGGAIYWYAYNGTINNCNFTNNTADSTGGAVYWGGSNGTGNNCNFISNRGTDGGAVYWYTYNGTVNNCNFTKNTVNSSGGAIYFYDLGTVENCNFDNSNASKNGGAVYFNSSGSVMNCNFNNNTAYSGGAISFSQLGSVQNCNFNGNKATNATGGAVYIRSSGTLDNCNFTDNSGGAGGAIRFGNTGNVANCNFINNLAYEGGWGGAILFIGNGTVENCNFADNSASSGGAVMIEGEGNVTNCNFSDNFAYYGGGAVFFLKNGEAVNCNFANNHATDGWGGAIYMYSASVSNCNFTDNTASDWGGAIYFEVMGDVTDCNFANNQAISGEGGAIHFKNEGNVTNCNFANNSAPNGGAIEFGGSGRLTICNFTNNQANSNSSYSFYDGGAVHFANSADVENCNFINNSARNGGAIESDGTANVKNCSFTDNKVTSGWGGAIYFNSNGNAENCNFSNNKAISGWGGAIYFNINSNGNVENCNFVNNSADWYGGAVYFNKNGNVENCNFINNSARYGGAIELDGTGNITDCNFANNYASWAGGAIYMSQGSVENCRFTDNQAKSNAGAVYIYGNGEVADCNFTGNKATKGSAIFFSSTSSNKTISNSIFLNNRANADAKTPFNMTINENNITITFMGQDNLINAIYSNGDVSFTNVTYWGADGITNTGSSTIKPSRSNREAGQNITVGIVVNDVVVNDVKVTNENGTVVLDVKVNGDYYIRVRHEEDSYYTEAETILSNMKYNVNVTSQTTNNKTVNITAKSNIYNETMPGKLLFILPNGDVINASYAFNGTWWAEYTFDDYGDYMVNASYIGLDNVTINNATISIIKANSTVNITDVVLDYGETKNVTVTTEGATGITAKIDDTSVTVVNNYTIPISGLNAGNYTLTVTTIPDADHNPVTKTVNLTVNKAPTEITLINETLELKVNDTVENVAYLTPGDAGNLTFLSSDENIVSVKDGKILARSNGTATVTVSFAGNENYAAAESKNITVTVAAIPVIKVNTTLASEDVVTVYNKTANVVATLNDADGKAISGAQVKIVLDNITEILTTDENGQVSLSTDGLLPGNYTAEITFDGDDAYNPSNTTAEVVINKINTTLVAKYENGTIFATVTDADGNPVSGLKVGFAINGVKYVISDENGRANYTVGDLEPGYYSVKVMAYGNDIYETSNQETVIVIKEQSKIFLRNALYFVLETKMVRVTLWDGHNNPIAGKTVHIAVADSRYSGVTDENGTAYIRVGVGFGVHNATVSFDGDEQYSSCNRTGNIRVIKETPSVMVRYADSQFKLKDNPKTIVVYLWDRNSKPLPEDSKVAIKLNGQTYVGYTDSEGVARMNINIDSTGTFDAQAVYAGNSAYNAVTRNIKITVSK